MTETPEIKQTSPSAARRKEAKKRAWDCFFTKGNSLTLIAATLIPLIMYMAAQGIYSMVYYAIDPEEFLSMGKATPLAGWKVNGRCMATICNGAVIYRYK